MEEVDAPVVRTASSSDKVGSPGRKGDRFYGCIEIEDVSLAPWCDADDLALSSKSFARAAVSHVYSSSVLVPSFLRCQYFLRLEDEHLVVIAASCERLAICTPSKAADLLSMTAHASKKRHATMPAEEVSILLIWPLD